MGGATKMYAIIETGGKQYKVSVGDVVFVEKLDVNEGDTYTFDKVLAISDENGSVIGEPYIDKATVGGMVLAQGKDKKIIIFKYKPKKGYKKKTGHRQPHTKIQIESINAKPAKKPSTKAAAKAAETEAVEAAAEEVVEVVKEVVAETKPKAVRKPAKKATEETGAAAPVEEAKPKAVRKTTKKETEEAKAAE